jgi:hypothetical protein
VSTSTVRAWAGLHEALPGDAAGVLEETTSARAAFARERQLKSWSREKKIRLIEQANAGWHDLAEGWLSGRGQ